MTDQSGCLGQGIHILGWIIVGIFVVTLPPTVILRASSALFFQPVAVTNSLQEGLLESGSLRQATVQLLLRTFSDPQNEEFLVEMTADLTSEDWRRISEIALPDAWLEAELQGLVTSLYDWLNLSQVQPELVLNVEPVKRRLIGEGSSEIVGIMVDSWPDCTLNQALEFEQAFTQSGELPLALCKLPEPYQAVMLARITEEFQQQARMMPSSLNLIGAISDEELSRLLPMKSQLRQLRFIARWSFLVPFSLLGLLIAFVVRSWRDWARWWAIPLLLGGVLTVFSSFVLLGVQPDWVANLIQSMELPNSLAGSVRMVFLELGERIIWRSAIWGGGIAAVGFLLLAISFLLQGPASGSIQLSKPPGGD